MSEIDVEFSVTGIEVCDFYAAIFIREMYYVRVTDRSSKLWRILNRRVIGNRLLSRWGCAVFRSVC